MKKFLLTLALLAPLSMSAEPTKKKGELAGIWQQVDTNEQDGNMMRLPVWKVLQKDGSFCVFLIAGKSGQSIIANQGTYAQTSDSTYTERLTGSITNDELVGKENTIVYHFASKDRLLVKYQLPGSKVTAVETWVRVKLEYPEE